MENNFFMLINEGDVMPEYIEDEEGKPQISISYSPRAQEFFDSNDDEFEKLIRYIEECFVVASLAGFEAPTEYYKAIKMYIESSGDGQL